MADLFKINTPAPNTPVASADIRNNFAALYEKLQTLEPRTSETDTKSIIITGGPVYFRSKTTNTLSFFQFQTTKIDLSSSKNGYITTKNNNGLTRTKYENGGISPFLQQNVVREVLISLNSDGKLYFTEGSTTTTGLSSPYNICFDDSEIPICLVLVRQSGDKDQPGQLQAIQQVDITDIRPFVTTAFANASTATVLETTTNAAQRLSKFETTASLTTQALLVKLPANTQAVPVASNTNVQLQITSGRAMFNGFSLFFSGTTINLQQNASADNKLSGKQSQFNKAVVCLERNISNNNLSTVLYHGTPSVTISNIILHSDFTNGFQSTTTRLPLAVVLYRVKDDNTIYPLIDGYGQFGNSRFDYDIPITINAVTASVTSFQVDLASFVTNAELANFTASYLTNQSVQLYDNNTPPFTRTVLSCSPVSTNSTQYTITLTESFIQAIDNSTYTFDLSQKQNPKLRLSLHANLIEDIRVFVGAQ